MKVIELIKNAKKTLFSFELLPPLKGNSIASIHNSINPLMEFSPSHINITYHQEEVVYKKLENGLLEKRSVRKRPGTVAISAAIKYKYPSVEVVPHIICGGFSKEETEYALIDFHFLGIDNMLAVRGDPPKSSRLFCPEKNGHSHSSELVEQIMGMNKGKYLDDEMQNITPTNFCVGVAGYPEKHIEAPNINSDLYYLKEKIDKGAEYIVTQMFFDNRKYIDFVDNCRANGINIPIIPGIKPITSLHDIKLIPQIFNIDIPEDLAKELRKCSTNEQAYQLGIEWTTAQSKELIKYGVPALHYFTIGISKNIKKIAEAVF